MNLAGIAIKNKAVTYFSVSLLFAAGLASFFALGQLEDPEYTIKTASITTFYPGASPEEVELEVTDRIEVAIQEMSQIDFLESFSHPGVSIIKVNIKSEFWSDKIPQIWDELRRKIRNVETTLPPGAGRPDVGDDFGDVFGFQLAITGDGFNYAELEKVVKSLRKELVLVDGVARIDLWGVHKKIIYLNASQKQLSELGLSDENFRQTLQVQNKVVDAGSLDLANRRVRIAPTGQFNSPVDIGNLQLRGTTFKSYLEFASPIAASKESPKDETQSTIRSELIRIRDIATVTRGYKDPPDTILRYNGIRAVGLSIANRPGINIVDMGRRVDKRLAELVSILPVGVEIHKMHWQSDIVDTAVKGFLINFAEAVAIVLVVLALFMGVRIGLVIGFALIATILGTFIIMAIAGIDLQRMSLGALVIALGMMVDNAIVVADGFIIRTQKGMDPKKAAIEAANLPAMPLLGATVVAVMAFYPIFASLESAGEYCRALFTVVGISLMVSWVIAMTVTPIMCIDLLSKVKGEEGADPYGGKFYTMFRGVLGGAIRMRWITMGGMVALLVISVVSFGNVKQLFFPDSSMPKFMVDYWAPEGTRIQQVAEDLKKIEARIKSDKRVTAVTSFIGSGPPRFYLPVEPENPNPSYAQIVVNVHDFKEIPSLARELTGWLDKNIPQALVPVRLFGVGPSNTWKFELRIGGPAIADKKILRGLADQVIEILENNPLTGYVRTDWRQLKGTVVPDYNQKRGRWAGITRDDIANATKRAFDGIQVGIYREQDDLIPILLRHVEEERKDPAGMAAIQVQPVLSSEPVPLSQVTTTILPRWEDSVIKRRDRRRTIMVQANPAAAVTLPTLRKAVLKDIEAIKLPPGYDMEWGAEFEDTKNAQASLVPGVIPAVVIMALIIVMLFNAFKPPLVILCTIPFALIGITAGLLAFDVPFGFVALLGAMSLVGMMIKNAVVLLDQVNIELEEGKSPYDAIVESAVSRLRPVALAAATTVLGVIPLLQDVFWIGMAVTIMVGLTFGTVLTMIVVPVLYCIFFKIPPQNAQVQSAPSPKAQSTA